MLGANMSTEKQFPSAQGSTPFRQSKKVKVASSTDFSETESLEELRLKKG